MARFVYFKEKDIILRFYSLKPFTTYFFYFDGKKITNRVKQFGKKLGQPLISDGDGKLSVVFYISSDIESNSVQSVSTKIKRLQAGNKEIILTTTDTSELSPNFKDSNQSYASILLVLQKNF